MHAPITVNYVPDGDDWTVTVTDEDRTRSATASGLIAARDQADQIVEKMVSDQTGRTVVHLLDGDAVAFTNTYLQARLGLAPTPSPENASPDGAAPNSTTPNSTTPNSTAPSGTAPSGTAPASAAKTPEPPKPPAATPAEDDSPELANVPAQGANQPS